MKIFKSAELIFTAILLSFVIFGCDNSRSASSNTDQAVGDHSSDHQSVGSHPAAPVHQSRPAVAEPAASIPSFKFYQLKSGFGFENTDIPAGRNSVFILFDPSCGHCQIEVGEIAKNYEKVKDVNLYFVSMNDPALMARFFPSFAEQLIDKANVHLLYDKDQQFVRQFHIPAMFPANYVYGSDGQLKTYWEGERDITEVLKAFTE